ncbi:hypothetical protein DFP90_102125 [Aestuariispira insulae]|uniref:Uncharacterized protein n=1 Tax=Aestuariispira insulae TaxID=1461337 RepID=A0A3D9HRH3_9PROT|nr:hypothetical protein DFP90_102125 [Aestuariispira insulae]
MRSRWDFFAVLAPGIELLAIEKQVPYQFSGSRFKEVQKTSKLAMLRKVWPVKTREGTGSPWRMRLASMTL